MAGKPNDCNAGSPNKPPSFEVEGGSIPGKPGEALLAATLYIVSTVNSPWQGIANQFAKQQAPLTRMAAFSWQTLAKMLCIYECPEVAMALDGAKASYTHSEGLVVKLCGWHCI